MTSTQDFKTYADLANRPTLCSGHSTNLKLDDGKTRLWIIRGDPGGYDGPPIIVERFVDGCWREIDLESGECFEVARRCMDDEEEADQ